MAEKAYYGIDEWNDIVYNELRNGRVVYLAGYNAKSGHAFVCDGYDKDDYFHINWGWVGLDDGYFKDVGARPLGARHRRKRCRI